MSARKPALTVNVYEDGSWEFDATTKDRRQVLAALESIATDVREGLRDPLPERDDDSNEPYTHMHYTLVVKDEHGIERRHYYRAGPGEVVSLSINHGEVPEDLELLAIDLTADRICVDYLNSDGEFVSLGQIGSRMSELVEGD